MLGSSRDLFRGASKTFLRQSIRDQAFSKSLSKKTEAVRRIVFEKHADGAEFTVAEISSATDTSDSYVRRLLQGWMKQHRVEQLGGGRDTRYRLAEKCQTDEHDTGDELDSNVGHPEAIILKSDSVPQGNIVIATPEDVFRNKIVPQSESEYDGSCDTELEADMNQEQDAPGSDLEASPSGYAVSSDVDACRVS